MCTSHVLCLYCSCLSLVLCLYFVHALDDSLSAGGWEAGGHDDGKPFAA